LTVNLAELATAIWRSKTDWDLRGLIEIELRSGVRVWVREGANGTLLTSVLDALGAR
jgi:hypothetical protein